MTCEEALHRIISRTTHRIVDVLAEGDLDDGSREQLSRLVRALTRADTRIGALR